MENSSEILILGSSGWLGSYLIPEINKQLPHSHLVAAYNSIPPKFNKNVKILQLSSVHPSALEQLNPDIIINLARGESDLDYDFHNHLINFSNNNNSRYIFASSSNAVDGDMSKPHLETDLPFSQSEYGKYKARCEVSLMKDCKRPVAFRFSATHGWAPNRIARTEDFLHRLSTGQQIPVGRGIMQNRTFIGDLANQILLLLKDSNAQGVYHLGTSDCSEEIDFLRQLAMAFGYNPDQIVEDGDKNWNLVTKVDKLINNYKNLIQLPTEKETIAKVRSQIELSKYIK